MMVLPGIRSVPDIPSCYFVSQFLVGTLGRDSYQLNEIELHAVRAVFKAFSDMVYGTAYLKLS